ncbi:MAG: DinB family protein [Acidobacteriota bacterium]|nr:DinB family protein [Acidobacteriota bacterium]
MESQLIETWQIHNRVHLYLLDSIKPEVLPEVLNAVSASKGRNVAEQFAHLHNVRLMWLKSAAPDLLAGLEKIEKEAVAGKQLLCASLEASGKAIETLLGKGFAEGKIKGFKPHAAAFLGYLISHESHHRGQIMLALKQAGYPVNKKVGFGIWEWGTR